MHDQHWSSKRLLFVTFQNLRAFSKVCHKNRPRDKTSEWSLGDNAPVTFTKFIFFPTTRPHITQSYDKHDYKLHVSSLHLLVCISIPSPSPHHWQDLTQGHFLRLQPAWIQSFPSPRSVAIPRLKRAFCSIVYL